LKIFVWLKRLVGRGNPIIDQIRKRPNLPDAFENLDIPQNFVKSVLGIICDSFLISPELAFHLRPEDDLGRIYLRGRKYRWVDEMEFERLFIGLSRLTGSDIPEFSTLETSIHVTVGQVIKFAYRWSSDRSSER
jgi:hypothetical protein